MTDHPERPLSTRECADYLGVSTTFIRDAIRDGGLKAERIQAPGRSRPIYRIAEADFIAFLQASGYTRTPKLRATGTD